MAWKSKQRPISSTWIYERIKGNNLSVLDIGCIIETKQPSDLTMALLDDKHTITGVSLRSCDYKHDNFYYFQTNILDCKVNAKPKYEIIIASQVIGFIGKRYERQKEILRGDGILLELVKNWLLPNGIFFCCVTLADHPAILKGNKKQVYSLSSIFNIFEGTGFNCLEFKTFPDASKKQKILPNSYEGVFMLNGNQ